MDSPPELQTQPNTLQIFHNYLTSKLKLIIEKTLKKIDDFSWEDLSQGKYGIDLRGFGNSKYEVMRLLSHGKYEDWMIQQLVHLIKQLKINGEYIFNQKTRQYCYLLYIIYHFQVQNLFKQDFELSLKNLILDIRYAVIELDVKDIYDEEQLFEEVLTDLEDTTGEEVTNIRILFDNLLKSEENSPSPYSYMINEPFKEIQPMVFGPNISNFEFRKDELLDLKNYVEEDKIVIVSGDQGVGKKYLVQKVLRTTKDKAVWITFERLHELLSGNNQKIIETHYLIIHSCKYADTIMNIVEYFKLFDTVKGWFILTNLKKNELFPTPDTYRVLEVKNFTQDESMQYISKRGGIEKYAKEDEIKKYIKFLTIQLSNNPWRVHMITQFIKSKKLKSTNIASELKAMLHQMMKQNIRNSSFDEQAQLIISMIMTDIYQKSNSPLHQFFLGLVAYLYSFHWDQQTVESSLKALDIYLKKESTDPQTLLQLLKHSGLLQEPLIGDKSSLFSIENTTLRNLKIIFSRITSQSSERKGVVEISLALRHMIKQQNLKITESFDVSKLFYFFDYTTSSLYYMKNVYPHACYNPIVFRLNTHDNTLFQLEAENEFCQNLIEEHLNNDLLDRKLNKDMLISDEQSIAIHFGIPKEDPNAETARKNYLESQLNKKGYTIKKNVLGDGNCQFRATADQLNLDDDKFHVMFRRNVVDWLRSNKNLKIGESDELHHFNYEFEDWDEFCDYMNENGVWGDHITLIALANYFSLRIKVISEVADPVIVLPENKQFKHKIFLYHHVSGRHYLSINPLNEEDELRRDEEIKRKEAERKLKEEEETKNRKEKEAAENELRKRKIESGEDEEKIVESEMSSPSNNNSPRMTNDNVLEEDDIYES